MNIESVPKKWRSYKKKSVVAGPVGAFEISLSHESIDWMVKPIVRKSDRPVLTAAIVIAWYASYVENSRN